jgi:hypothetical protein
VFGYLHDEISGVPSYFGRADNLIKVFSGLNFLLPANDEKIMEAHGGL